jgi:hypothetical protein
MHRLLLSRLILENEHRCTGQEHDKFFTRRVALHWRQTPNQATAARQLVFAKWSARIIECPPASPLGFVAPD